MRRIVLAALLPGLLLLLGATPASAHDVSDHEGSEAVASDLRSSVLSSDLPAVVELDVLANGESLRLENNSGQPATVLREDGSQRLTVAPGATARWHEDAAHPDNSDVDEDNPVAAWQVSLLVGDAPHRVEGEIRWDGGPSPVGWILLALGIAGAAGVFAWRAGRGLVSVAVPLLGAVLTSVVHTGAAFAAREPVAGRWDVAGDYLPVAGCWLLGILAGVMLLRGNRDGGWLAALAAAGLALVVASGDAAVLWSSTLVVDLPDGLDRVVVSAVLGLIAGTLVAVPLAMRRTRVGSAP